MSICIIPARGGSKRIPRKNIKDFCGKPMIRWSIDAAIESGCFDRILVSTDDAEISDYAVSAGVEVPFQRPAELSDDHTGTTAVVQHMLQWLSETAAVPVLTCCLYATAPFVRAQDILRGRDALGDADFALPVTSFPFPIQRAVRITATGRVEMFQPENFAMRSQDLEDAYHDVGQFYWGQSTAWRQGKAIFNSDTKPVLIARHRAQDIDTPEDWLHAEALFKALSL